MIVIVQMFSQEVGVNKWKIVYVTCWKVDNLSVCTGLSNRFCGLRYLYYMSCVHVIQVKKHFENSGYTADGEPVDVQVTSDEETIPVTVQNVTTGWSVEQLQVCIYRTYCTINYVYI